MLHRCREIDMNVTPKCSLDFRDVDVAVASGAVFTKTEEELEVYLGILDQLRTKDLNVKTRVRQCREVVRGCLRSHASLQPVDRNGFEPIHLAGSSLQSGKVVRLARSSFSRGQSTLVLGLGIFASLVAFAFAALALYRH